jgi:cytochrome c551/c552
MAGAMITSSDDSASMLGINLPQTAPVLPEVVGPALADIGKKYAGQAAYLSERIRAGSSGVWGNIPMPPQALSPEDAQAIAQWLATRQ